MKKQSEDELFQALKGGSESAFKEVYEGNRKRFLNFARKYGLADEDLLDIYQDTYIALFENIQNGRLSELHSSLSTYMLGIGKYKILERLRKMKKRVDNDQILKVVREVDEHLESFDLVHEELSPEQKQLRRYFEELGEKCKAILTMFYFRKYSVKQIMEAGGYNSENVVKSQKSRCLKTLKEYIKNA
jgi:RNA polymerase sigma-70 factor (ECF subfamily)